MQTDTSAADLARINRVRSRSGQPALAELPARSSIIETYTCRLLATDDTNPRRGTIRVMHRSAAERSRTPICGAGLASPRVMSDGEYKGQYRLCSKCETIEARP